MYAPFLSCPYASLHPLLSDTVKRPLNMSPQGIRMSASIFSIWFNQDRLGFGAATCPNQAFPRPPLQQLIGRGTSSMWPPPGMLLTLYLRYIYTVFPHVYDAPLPKKSGVQKVGASHTAAAGAQKQA